MRTRDASGIGGAAAHAFFSLIALAAMATCAPAGAQGTGCYGVPAVPTPPTSGYIDVRTYGAVPNDEVDDAPAIQKAIDAAQPGQWIRFPAGRYVMTHHVEVKTSGVTLWSDGATLHGTNLQDRAVMLMADRTRIYGFTLTSDGEERTYDNKSGRIVATFEGSGQSYISGVVIQANRIVPPAGAAGALGNGGAGIMVQGVRDFTVAGNEVRRPLADGIHVTGGSQNGRVVRNKVYQAGDDMIAVVSYFDQEWVAKSAADPTWLSREIAGTVSRNIWIAENTLSDQFWGRGITVGGGANITLARNQISRATYAAGIYVVRESNLSGVNNVLIDSNTVTDVLTTEPLYMPQGPLGERIRAGRVTKPTGAGGLTIEAFATDMEQAQPNARQLVGIDRVTVRNNVIQRTKYAGVRLGAFTPAGFVSGLTFEGNQVVNVGTEAYVNPAYMGALIPLTCKPSRWSTVQPTFAGCAAGAALPPAPVATGATLDCSRFPAP